MKPRWKIDPRPHVAFVHDYQPSCREAWWFWVRSDRNGGLSVVGCVCHHSWTSLVRRSVEVPDAAP